MSCYAGEMKGKVSSSVRSVVLHIYLAREKVVLVNFGSVQFAFGGNYLVENIAVRRLNGGSIKYGTR